jgi:hypothetical protein
MKLLCAAFALLLPAVPALADPPPVDFNRDIRPILSDRCFHCHGPDSATRKAGLRLDEEASAKAEVIVPGDAEASELIRRILTTDQDDHMPPAEAEKPRLTPDEAALFRRWIDEGAAWANHWAYVAPTQPTIPDVSDATWPRNPVDNFVLARLEEEGLAPSPEADPETLLRRVSLDLTGLPPTIEELNAFLADPSPEAYEQAVDRLLASPHYGEHRARRWLDGARYADTNGYQNDFFRNMWPWRDWVIEAFNDNMPFDQFTIEQIAGDMLPDATEDQRVATGFLRNNRGNTEGGSIEEEWYVENRVDRVETVSAVWMGTTMGCARCHDHKYDPVSQKEFYEFYAFFNSSADKGFYEEVRGNVGPIVTFPTEDNARRLARFDEQIDAAQDAVREARHRARRDFDDWKEHLLEGAAAATDEELLLRVPLTEATPATSTTEALLADAVTFAGEEASHLDLGQAVTFEADKPFTVSAWVKPEAPGAIFSKMDDASNHRGVDLFLWEGGGLSVHLIDTWPDNAVKVSSDKRIPMGQWSHVTVTYDGSGKASGIGIYTNGIRGNNQIEKNSLDGSLATDQPLRIGRRSSSLFYKGAMTDFRVYGRALSEAEVIGVEDDYLRAAIEAPATDTRTAAIRAFYDGPIQAYVQAKNDVVGQLNREKVDYERRQVNSVMVMEELPEQNPTYRLVRGAYDQPDTSEELYPAIPAFLPPLPENASNNRLGLAKWLVDESNPLTARVTVNRLWSEFFGRGFVKTVENFGVQSEPPTHPELLDWLALDFMASGWDYKALQKRIVMSATYRQASRQTEELRERDPENRLIARGPRFRMPAEMIRDNALAVSGLLVETIGGPPVKPYQPEGLWTELAGGASQGPYKQDEGEALYRRSLYTYRKRTVPPPSLTTFDAPSWELCRVQRARTNTPLQALALLNDTTYGEAARHLAWRMINEPGARVRDRVTHGFRLCTGRAPTPTELETLQTGLRRYIAVYSEDEAAAKDFIASGESPVPDYDDPATFGAYTALASVLLNLDETITKE